MRARLVILLLGIVAALPAHGDRVSDIRQTRHNLSTTGPGTTKATVETQVCVFCHTPHGATQTDQGGASVRAPLWNRTIPAGSTYTSYTSASLDANVIQGQLDQPGGSSKLCLSCHDGTLALGNVNVLNGQAGPTIAMSGTGPGGTMPPGAGTGSGFTRNLGVDLRNDHPISVTFTSQLAARDGELRALDVNQRYPAGTGAVIGVREPGVRPRFPLEGTGLGGAGQVQCGTCHDPHLFETDPAKGAQKFLRGQRFQEAAPSASGFSEATDILCIGCHDKNMASGAWANSAHANPQVADETYTAAAAALREFPAGMPVWRAACLNCHDTHTVQGARRLTREGTDSPLSPKQGGAPALEQTCYQCHTTAARSALATTVQVPNIETEFGRARRMPITTLEQGGGSEVHDIGGTFNDIGFVDCTTQTNKCGADFLEGRNLLASRHAECTDCHNPHRVIRNRLFNANPAIPDAAGTHRHDEVAGYTHTNIASGVLRGTWGVEPVYGSASFQQMPTSFLVKRGDPGASLDTSPAAPYVTREYQVCLKCHSNYGYSDNNLYPNGSRPLLGYVGGTLPGTNNLTQYTNQAREFQAPLGHQGQRTTTDSGAGSGYSTNNHRSWHPVMDATGRTLAIRNISLGNPWRLPWSNAVGTQTMYCSDCHGGNVISPTSVIPNGGENGEPWGPHGSDNNFLLKGPWSNNAADLCFKCHEQQVYSPTGDTRKADRNTGFCCKGGDQLHWFHWDKLGRPPLLKCNWCHVAVPHGWKNKALLVNLNDVGPEAGLPGNAQWGMGTSAQAYNQEPYYMNAKLKVRTFATSGNWTDANCGSSGSAGVFGPNAAGNSTATGRDWMRAVCTNPP